ncbi:MAG TPA: hypothetical protein VMA13_06315 [Candidatus Saccharimonadales bacterium]|nr:hypothetical protein [Candidatus Saccharimonadales bacterium]
MKHNNCRTMAVILSLLGVSNTLPAWAESPGDQIAALKKEKDGAFFRIQDIVNQPVTHLKRAPDMVVQNFVDWGEHDVVTPDFNTVDIRTTQQAMFDGYQYVTCDLNPDEVFIGKELEFNEMTKYFYNNFNEPKKKLTEAEMLEINQLCRVIGRCNRQLDEVENPETPLAKVLQVLADHKPAVIAVAAVLAVTLYVVRKSQSQKAAY